MILEKYRNILENFEKIKSIEFMGTTYTRKADMLKWVREAHLVGENIKINYKEVENAVE